ncbi:MAG TPA: ABC transporter permease [Thermoanaerobaculia bacterium]|nr:ABC transporter permease [Thermoanaerobaculia bacterium]
MIVYVIRRLLYALLTFLGITVATFALIHAVPGDPLLLFAGQHATGQMSTAAIAEMRHEYHLDEPLARQYLYWLRGVVSLDFGRSFVDRRPVTTRVVEKLPRTLLLNTIAFIIAALIGVPVGLWSAARAGRLLDRGSAVTFFLLYSLPTFWVGLLLMELISVRLGILPLFGVTSDGYSEMGAAQQILDRTRHLILPVVTLAYGQLAIFARFSRSALREVIRQDFVTTARAKGVGEGGVVWHHAFRNALLPIITLIGLVVPYLISGSVIVEDIFQWDGIGLLYFDSIRARDYPTIMALTVVTAAVTLLATLIADLLYAAADPRVRLGAAA